MRLFRLDEYNEAAGRVVYRWIDRRSDELAPSLREFPRLEVEHVRTSRMTLPDASVARIQPVRQEDGGQLNIREAVAGRLDDLRASLNGVADRRARRMVAFWEEQQARGLLAGAVAKGSGPPSWDSVMDGLEELALTFDEAGEPNIKIVAGSAAAPLLNKLGPRDAGQEQRWKELMMRKKEEARARERHRRLA